MRNLVFGLILGLLSVVHTIADNTVTQIPAKAEDDVIREAVTDGFLVDVLVPSHTTESTQINASIAESHQPSPVSMESEMLEGSGGEGSESKTIVFMTSGSTNTESTTSVAIESMSTTTESTNSMSTPSISTIPESATSVAIGSMSTTPESATSVAIGSMSTTPETATSVAIGSMSTTTESMTSVSTPSMSTTSESTTSMFMPSGSTNTTPDVSHAQNSASTVLREDTDDSSPHSSTTQIPQSTSSSSTEANEAESSTTSYHIFVSQTSDPLSSDSGSGDGGMFVQSSTTTTNTETTSESSTTMAALPGQEMARNNLVQFSNEGSGEGSGEYIVPATSSVNHSGIIDTVVSEDPLPLADGQSTPGWIIIVGFIVGIAALVMLFVAIATRDKWNGPRETFQPEIKANSQSQQREIEMETFLHKDIPKENGKAAEYTVIPLEELPEKY